ncbi:hypothetical protein ACFV2X_11440 [Streptomyces sp. NPDC059679]|uniref:hypothetical protein n=1 Tax=Streptomyces sp. NPDC059679 TaxID=3346903 RepID=UPI0036856556
MFTVKADALSATLDKVVPHRSALSACLPDLDQVDMVLLDCTRSWLHVVVAGERTMAVARTRIENTTHWSAPVAYADVDALCAWLDSSDEVHVQHTLDGGRPLLHFTEGAARATVPVASHMAELPWREVLLAEAPQSHALSRAVRMSSRDLALWEHAGKDIEVWPAAGVAAFIVTSGPDFIGLQLPHLGSPVEVVDGWQASLRTRRFLYEGIPYEVGASYTDQWGMVWRVAASPAPGEEPLVVSADRSSVALPLAVVLQAGGRLTRDLVMRHP